MAAKSVVLANLAPKADANLVMRFAESVSEPSTCYQLLTLRRDFILEFTAIVVFAPKARVSANTVEPLREG